MKQAFALVVLIVTPSIIFAQGTIYVSNSGLALVQQWKSASDSSLSPVATNGGTVQFLAAADGTAYKPLGTLGTGGFALTYSTLETYLAANTGWNAYSTANIAPVPGRSLRAP